MQRKLGDTVRAGETLAVIESNESLRTYNLAAPISGVITERNANPGEQSGDGNQRDDDDETRPKTHTIAKHWHGLEPTQRENNDQCGAIQ